MRNYSVSAVLAASLGLGLALIGCSGASPASTGSPSASASAAATANAAIAGKVVGPGGPLYGAVVSDGANSTITGTDGSFSLSVATGSHDLTVAKTGFQPGRVAGVGVATGATAQAGTIALAALGRPPRVVFEASKAPLGGANLATLFADLIATLNAGGYQASVGPAGSLPDMAAADILVVVAPAQPYSADELNAIRAFVAGGHKLVLLGEWGGLSETSNAALDGLANTFNLNVGNDLIKDFDATAQLPAPDPATGQSSRRADYVLVTRFAPHPVTSGVQALAVFGGASVQLVNTTGTPPDPYGAAVVAGTSNKGLQVAALNATFGVLGTAVAGAGTVVVSGDASMWSSADSDSSGSPDLAKRNNKQLALNAFAW